MSQDFRDTSHLTQQEEGTALQKGGTAEVRAMVGTVCDTFRRPQETGLKSGDTGDKRGSLVPAAWVVSISKSLVVRVGG